MEVHIHDQKISENKLFNKEFEASMTTPRCITTFDSKQIAFERQIV